LIVGRSDKNAAGLHLRGRGRRGRDGEQQRYPTDNPFHAVPPGGRISMVIGVIGPIPQPNSILLSPIRVAAPFSWSSVFAE
jgi:hypothetical protein